VIRYLTAGESHGPELTVIVDGIPAGIPIDGQAIDAELLRRQSGYGRGARSTKIERDHAEITSGIAGGLTTGAPIALRIVNKDFANQPASRAPLTAPRPGHADLAGHLKYGHADLRTVRERASARETAARVAAGALAKQLLQPFGTTVRSFVTAIGDVEVEPGPVPHDGVLRRRTANRAGGVEGGTTNGEPVIVRAAMKPLSSVRASVDTVDLATGLASDAPYVRSDVCAVSDATVVGEAMIAWVLAEAVVERFGGDRLEAMLAAREAMGPDALP